MALTAQQIAFNKLPYNEQQKQINNTYMDTKKATVNPYVEKVNSAIASTNGNVVNKNNDISTNKSPAQVVGNVVGNVAVNEEKPRVASTQVPMPSYSDTYNKGIADGRDKYEKTISGMQTREQATQSSEDARLAEAEAIRARVRAAIEQGTQAQNKIINDAPAQFVDPMNRASFQGMKNIDSLKESLARRGRYYSGDMDIAEMVNNNQTSANINELENSKAKVISDARAAIANLQASGSLQEVQLVSEAAARSLERLQNQINVIDNRTNEQATTLLNNSNNALKTTYDIGANERQLGMQQQGLTNAQTNADRSYDLQNKTYNTGIDQWNQTFNQDKTNSDRTFGLQQDSATLNKMNTMAGLTGQIPANELIAQMSPTQIEAYKNLVNQDGGYASAINSTNDPVQKAIINEFRNQYLQQNPNNQYANTQTATSMVPTMQGRQVDSGLQNDAMQRATMTLDNLAKQYNLDNILPQELARAKQLISIGEEELAAKIFENTKAPEEFKMKMSTMAEQISASKSNTEQGWKSLEIQQQNTDKKDNLAEKPYTTTQKNQYVSEAASTYKSYNTVDAVKNLIEDQAELVSKVGVVGYKQIWDLALGEAVKRGETQSYSDYFKDTNY